MTGPPWQRSRKWQGPSGVRRGGERRPDEGRNERQLKAGEGVSPLRPLPPWGQLSPAAKGGVRRCGALASQAAPSLTLPRERHRKSRRSACQADTLTVVPLPASRRSQQGRDACLLITNAGCGFRGRGPREGYLLEEKKSLPL